MRKVLTALVAALVMTVWSGQSLAQDYKWRMATIDRETGIYWTTIAQKWADLVEKLTSGRMKIEPLPAGTVGNIFKLHEAVDDGLVEMANWPPIFLGTADPTNAMIASFPTGLGTDSFHAWLYQGGGQELWVQHRKETMGMHAIIVGSGPSEWFAHSHVAVRTTKDLEGLKYRTLGNWAAVVKDKFGASPTTVPGSEIYGMLEKKGIDLAEYSMPGENFARGYHEIAKYLIYPGIHAPAWAFEVLIKQEKWNELPDDIKTAMEVAGRVVTHDSFLQIINGDLDAVKKLQDAGKNEFIRLSPEFVDQAREAARAWAAKASADAKAKGNEWPEKVFKSLTTFQDRWRAGSKYLVVDHQD
ncbi:MAG: TRAP transporter substrate-binding protein DctP [Hyphomicrobiales bacterium]